MSSRWKKVWADFWGNKARTLLTILTIMVGTLAIGFISNLQSYMIESMDSDYLSTSPSEAKIDAYPMNDDTVRIVREMRGVKAVEGRSRAGGQILHVDGEKIPVQITAIEDPGDMLVDRLQPVRNGPGIPPLGYRELLVDVSAASLGYKPGDSITVELNNGKQRKLRLAGYIHDATGVSYSRARYVTAFVTPKTIEWLGGSLNYDMLAVSVAENPTDFAHVTQVAQTIKKRLEQSGLTVTSIVIFQPPGHHYAYKLSQAIFLVMAILGWLTVLLSCFLVLNTITALMSQQTRQIGLMKATGADTLQVFGMYIVLILSFGVIALLVAVPLAGNVAQRIGNGMAAFMGFYTSPYRAYPATLLQQITIALVLPLLAAVWPVYNSVRQTVRPTLTDYGIGGSEKPRTTAVRRSNLILPRPIRLSLRNAFRRKARLALTLFTLVLGGATFISVINLRGSFYRLIDELRGYYLTDVDISFARSYRFDKVADMAKNVPGVESLEGWLQYNGSLVREDSKVES